MRSGNNRYYFYLYRIYIVSLKPVGNTPLTNTGECGSGGAAASDISGRVAVCLVDCVSLCSGIVRCSGLRGQGAVRGRVQYIHSYIQQQGVVVPISAVWVSRRLMRWRPRKPHRKVSPETATARKIPSRH